MAVRIGVTGDVMLGRLVDERQGRRPATAVWGPCWSGFERSTV
jgi:hypothetical protein